MALRTTSALVLLASLITRTVAQRSCFFPDGTTSPPDVPCNANADESACCGADSFCMSNGLCFNSGVISRGSCTDRTWQSSSCAQQCTTENLDAGLTLLNCDARLGTWICATDGNSCDDEADLFPIDNNDMNQIMLRPTDANSSPLLLTPNSTLGGNSSSSDGDSGSGSDNAATVTVTAAPDASESTTSDAQYTAGQMAGVGAGVGVPLLLALLGAIFVITRQRRRLQAAEAYGKENELKPTQHQGYGGGYGGHAGQQQPMPYGHFAPGQEPKVQSSAAYYRPISPSPPQGHFREVEPVMEMDGEVGRQELSAGK